MHRISPKIAVSVTTLVGIGVPVLGAFLANRWAAGHAWRHEPLHSVVETLGSLAGVSLAVMLRLLRRYKAASFAHIWLSASLIGMGVLDGVHAAVRPGEAFVWLHSVAALIGGLYAALAWIPDSLIARPSAERVPLVALGLGVLLGALGVIAPELLPAMRTDAGFTPTAQLINVLAGVLFFAAAAHFWTLYLRDLRTDDFLFTNFLLLFGMAGALFPFSRPWEADWWWWHLLRLAAYTIAFTYAFQLYRRAEEEVVQLNVSLERKVAERSASAERRARELTDANQRLTREVDERHRAEEALRRSEQRHRLLTEGTRDAIVVADERGTITLFNAAARRTFGYEEHEAIGQPVGLLMPDELRPQHEAGLSRFVRTREPRVVGRTVELVARRKSGEVFPIELSLSALELPGEGVIFLASIRDISERRLMQSRVFQAEKLASLGLLSAGLAHEINNPLAYVANNLAVLQRDIQGVLRILELYDEARPRLAQSEPELIARVTALDEELDLPYLRQNLGPIIQSTRDGLRRVADIVKNLRNFARLDRAEVDRVNLHEAIDQSLELIRSRLERRAITVEKHYGELPHVSCAPAQINQVVLNLLVNAMQAIESAGRSSGRIVIRTRDENGAAVIEVEDDGPGIPPEVLPRIFDPFFTTKPQGEGMGLGLSISHGIVTDHGGRLEVESAVGRFTRFRVALPIHAPEPAP